MQRLWTEHDIIAPSHTDVDLTDTDAVERILTGTHPDLVINATGYNNVDKAETDDRDLAFALNYGIPTRLATLTHDHNTPFIHFSTDYVFDGTQPNGYTEADQPNPISIYGESKHKGEQGVLRENPYAYIVRTSRLYGFDGSSHSAKRTFIQLIIDDATKAQTVPVNPTEVSSPTFIDDLVHHIETHLFSLPNPGIYHITNSGGATWMEWAQEIVKHLEPSVTIVPRDLATLVRAAARPQSSILLSTKLPPMRPWQDALHDFLSQHPWPFHPLWQPQE